MSNEEYNGGKETITPGYRDDFTYESTDFSIFKVKFSSFDFMFLNIFK